MTRLALLLLVALALGGCDIIPAVIMQATGAALFHGW